MKIIKNTNINVFHYICLWETSLYIYQLRWHRSEWSDVSVRYNKLVMMREWYAVVKYWYAMVRYWYAVR